MQGINVDIFDGLVAAAITVLPTSTFGLADAFPVGGTITGAGERLGLDKRLDHQRTETVPTLEIVRHPAHAQPENPGRQVATLYPGSDQKPTHADHRVQPLRSGGVVPPDPALAVLKAAGGAAEGQSAKPAVVRTHEVPKLTANQRTGAPRMLADHQFVPDSHPFLVLDQNQAKVRHLLCGVRHTRSRCNRIVKTPRTAQARRRPCRRQLEFACLVKGPQGLQATAALRRPPRIDKTELLTHTVGQRRPVRYIPFGEGSANKRKRVRRGKLSFDLVLSYHASTVNCHTVFGQRSFVGKGQC